MFPQSQKPYVHQDYPAVIGYLPTGKAIIADSKQHHLRLCEEHTEAQAPQQSLTVVNLGLEEQVRKLSDSWDELARENQDLKEQLERRGVDVEELTAKLAAKNKKQAAQE